MTPSGQYGQRWSWLLQLLRSNRLFRSKHAVWHPEITQSRWAKQCKQSDWISQKTEGEGIHACPERPAAVIKAQHVVCVVDQSDNHRRA